MNGERSWPRTLVVIPAYNEQASISSVLADVHKSAPFADIVVVDDGSLDRTAETAANSGVTVLRLPFNLGVGGAMRAGFAYAKEHGYGALVQVDADGQHDPAYLPDLLAGLDDADVVIGSRFAGDNTYKVSSSRRFAMRILAGILGRMNRRKLTDVTSGFRASGPRAIKVMAAELPAEYLGDTVEALVICRKAGLTVAEVPVQMRQRMTGSPSQGLVSSVVHLARAFLVILLAAARPRSAAAATSESA